MVEVDITNLIYEYPLLDNIGDCSKKFVRFILH